MTLDEFLPLLDRPRKSGKGWLARCPAHEDRNPSLSIREGERGILLRCWSGCRTEEIVSSLGIQIKDLFFDAGLNSQEIREMVRQGKWRQEVKALSQVTEFKKADLLREAQGVIEEATGIDDTSWTEEKRDRIMGMVSEAITVEILEMGDKFYV